MPLAAPVPLPADLDTMPRRDLVALCEQRGFSTPAARATADDLRETLRSNHRIAVECYRREQMLAVREEWFAHPAHAVVREGAAAQVMRDSLWGLANLYGRVQSETDSLVHTVEAALPVLSAFLDGDARVTPQDARNEVQTLVYALNTLRRNREEAADYAGFTMGDAARRVTALREQQEARNPRRR